MKIFHFNFGRYGGSERLMVTLASAFARRGIEQKFILRPNRAWGRPLKSFGEVLEDPNRRFSPRTFFMRRRLERICEAWEPDVILLWMERAIRLAPSWDGAPKILCAGSALRPHFCNLDRCDGLVGCSPVVLESARELGWDKPSIVIPNFVHRVSVEPINRKVLNTPSDAFVVVASGRFLEIKGFDLLIRAVAQIPDAFLWLVGDGRERKRLHQLVESEGISERVRFVGWVNEPVHYLASADVAVMPSRSEGFGLALIEAWKARVPSISTRSEGPSWYARDECDCLLIDIDDLDGLVNAIERLRDDSKLRERLVEGARERLDTMLSEEAVVNAWMKFFSDLSSASS